MADRYDDRYREDRGERGYGRDERGWNERAGDEVRSWFGDEEAERRRRMDEQRYGRDWDWGHRMGFDYGRPPARDWSERGHGSRGERGWSGERWGTGDRSTADSRSDYDRPAGRDWNESQGERPYRGTHSGTTGYGPSQTYISSGGYGSNYGFREYNDTGRYGQGTERWRGMEGQGTGRGREGGYAGRGPRGYQRSDERIREDVCDRLCDDPWVDATEIEVTVRAGEVTLAGAVRDRLDKRRTEDLIESISGVREVHNNLRVGSGWEGTTSHTQTAAPTTKTGKTG